jgi:hypothetical protein
MVTLAGSAAQWVAGYPKDVGLDSDLVNAGNCAGMLARLEAGLPLMPGPDEPQELSPGDPMHTASLAIVNRALAETVAMLRDNWLAVERVAGALRKRDRHTEAEVDHVIAHGQRGWRR